MSKRLWTTSSLLSPRFACSVLACGSLLYGCMTLHENAVDARIQAFITSALQPSPSIPNVVTALERLADVSDSVVVRERWIAASSTSPSLFPPESRAQGFSPESAGNDAFPRALQRVSSDSASSLHLFLPLAGVVSRMAQRESLQSTLVDRLDKRVFYQKLSSEASAPERLAARNILCLLSSELAQKREIVGSLELLRYLFEARLSESDEVLSIVVARCAEDRKLSHLVHAGTPALGLLRTIYERKLSFWAPRIASCTLDRIQGNESANVGLRVNELLLVQHLVAAFGAATVGFIVQMALPVGGWRVRLVSALVSSFVLASSSLGHSISRLIALADGHRVFSFGVDRESFLLDVLRRSAAPLIAVLFASVRCWSIPLLLPAIWFVHERVLPSMENSSLRLSHLFSLREMQLVGKDDDE